MAKLIDLVIIVSLALGVFYTFFPHRVHMKYSPDWTIFDINLPHYYHMTIGIIFLMLSVYFINNK